MKPVQMVSPPNAFHTKQINSAKKAYLQIVIIIKDLKNSSILPPLWPCKNKIDNNIIKTIMIKSLFTSSDYNKSS